MTASSRRSTEIDCKCGKPVFLRIGHVSEQCAGGNHATRKFIATEPRQVPRAKLRGQQSCRTVEFKVPGWALRRANVVAE